MSVFNSNAFHNLLNLILIVLMALIGYDWTALGVSATVAVQIASAIGLVVGILKLLVNTTRDGVTGLVAPQPPVVKKP
jgi:hypothetical protein